ncbi:MULTISPECIES: DUF3566 domain-containing protein [unclassified Saccharopolyspora]|uniref:DUF3566 domain-containing protein n=1 Tax=unclassified Saccharopolyspora TaxID=2646250 RepID=UPI001CD642FF|nr:MULTISPECIES: DUF3566 domain-containing protein [unclassified Saccharopolyspora]MCA1191812.1 DUF3566 domain-containing protein [Saccharopolyspora sp. 6V]MCA1226021.1 DUF3566 domain-containing protein [Saccharopolyspora sp. 6M]
MTSSEKPERPDGHPGDQDAEPTNGQNSQHTSVMTGQTAATGGDGDTSAAADGNGEASSKPNGSETFEGTEAPPPWQRTGAGAGSADGGAEAQPGFDTAQTQGIPKPGHDQETVRTEIPKQGADGRTAVNFGAAARPGAQSTSARRPSRGPRRASLQVKRLDPWSVLKLALVLSVAMFFVWMIAVAVLYGVLDGMGVWDSLNGTFTELTSPEDAASEELISAGRVFGVASIIGAINIVLFTALATVSAFIYNVAADFAGGVEVTLSERE